MPPFPLNRASRALLPFQVPWSINAQRTFIQDADESPPALKETLVLTLRCYPLTVKANPSLFLPTGGIAVFSSPPQKKNNRDDTGTAGKNTSWITCRACIPVNRSRNILVMTVATTSHAGQQHILEHLMKKRYVHLLFTAAILSFFCFSTACSWIGETAGRAKAGVENAIHDTKSGYHRGYAEGKS